MYSVHYGFVMYVHTILTYISYDNVRFPHYGCNYFVLTDVCMYDLTNRESLKQKNKKDMGKIAVLCYRAYPIWFVASPAPGSRPSKKIS